MLAHKSSSIAPPDPEEKVQVKAISRPAVVAAALTLTAALVISILVTSPPDDSRSGIEASLEATQNLRKVEEAGEPAFLKNPPSEDPDLAARRAALEQLRRSMGLVDTTGAVSPATRADSVALARSILQRLMGQRGQPAAPDGLPRPDLPGLSEEERRTYRQQLDRRSRLPAISGSSASATRDPVQEAYRAGVVSSPIVFNGGFSDRSAARGGEARLSEGNATPGWLTAAQQMAEARGDTEMASALAMLAETAAAETGEEPMEAAPAAAPVQPRPIRQIRVQMELPLSAYEIKEGTLLPAILETAINSDLAGSVRARITRDVFDSRTQQHLLIPKGSTLIGSSASSVAVGQNRLAVAWERIILPDGRSISLETWETKDGEGASGVRGDVNHHFFRIFTSALMVSLIGAGVSVATYQQGGGYGAFGYPGASPGQMIGSSVASEFGEVATELLRRNINISPTITLPAGQPFHVFVNADMAFDLPYVPADGLLTDW